MYVKILARFVFICCQIKKLTYFASIISGTENLLTIMLEAEALNIDRHLFLDGVKVGLESCSKIASSLKSAADTFKVEKRQFKSSSLPQETVHSISKDMELLCEQKIRLEKILVLKMFIYAILQNFQPPNKNFSLLLS